MLVLGIETSCDETAAAVVSDEAAPRIRANLVLSQMAEHRPYGGIVPEIAARAHLDHLDGLIARALAEAGVGFERSRGGRGDRRAGPHRRRHRRRHRGQGHRLGARAALHRGQSPRRPCAEPRGSPTMWRFPICCCWSRAAIASC